MRIRATGAGTIVAALILAACGGPVATQLPAASPTPTTAATPTKAATASPSTAASASPTTAASASATTGATATTGASGSPAAGTWKIGVVTDVGTIDDKNFNQYSFEGAKLGAVSIGAPVPDYVVPKSATDYGPDIQNFVDNGYNIIVTVGFNLTPDTLKAAKANPNIWFVAVDQSACVDATGNNDTTFACAGDASKLLPNFVGLQYQEDQAGYLVGIVAASLAKNHSVAAIGGINLVPAVVRYLQGYELGAKSVTADVTFNSAYVTTSDFVAAFNKPDVGKTTADQFISTNHPDVMFQVAGKTGNGVLQSTCTNNLIGIGVDVDQWLSLNADNDPTYQCIVTSAEKHLSSSVQSTIDQIAAATPPTTDAFGSVHFNAANDGIGISPEHDGKGLITPAILALVNTALDGMKAGTVVSCPTNCGTAQ